MITALKGPGKLRPLLVLVVGVLLCWPAPRALGDELQYLPTDPHMVASLNFSAFLKSKTFQELKKLAPKLGEDVEVGIGEHSGIPSANIARITGGLVFSKDNYKIPEDISIITTTKAVNADEIKAKIKSYPSEKNVAYKEVKVGTFTIYQRTYQFQIDLQGNLGPVQEGETFCVAESKVVLWGQLPVLTKILERNKKSEQSANLKTELKEAPLTSEVMLVLDIENMPPWRREIMMQPWIANFPETKDVADKLKLLAVKMSEAKSVKGTATLWCKTKSNATEIKKIADSVQAGLPDKLKDKALPDQQEIVKSAITLIKAVKLSAKGDKVTANVTVEPATVAQFLTIMKGKPKMPKKIETEPKKSTDGTKEVK
jgi:hypothetical protein